MAGAVARAALGAAAVAALLAGCRTMPAPAPLPGPGADAPWLEQRAALEKLERYSLSGRVAVAARGEGFSGALRYQQQPQRSELALDGPLGMGGMRVVLEGDALSITNSKGERLDDSAARVELEGSLGFQMPIEELRWWLLGIPAPGEANVDADAVSGEIRSFVQDGWKISIESRSPALGFGLPQRLTATREGARMKLLVDRWQP
jgi:outer membrane lipoprotein LolB